MELINTKSKTINIDRLEVETLLRLRDRAFSSVEDFIFNVDQIGQELFEIEVEIEMGENFADEWNANEVRDFQNIDLLQSLLKKGEDAEDVVKDADLIKSRIKERLAARVEG